MNILYVLGFFLLGAMGHAFFSRLIRSYQMVSTIKRCNLIIITLTRFVSCALVGDCRNLILKGDLPSEEKDRKIKDIENLIEIGKNNIINSIFLAYPAYLYKVFGFEKKWQSAIIWADNEIKKRKE